MLGHLLKVAQECHKLQDFNSSFAVLDALQGIVYNSMYLYICALFVQTLVACLVDNRVAVAAKEEKSVYELRDALKADRNVKGPAKASNDLAAHGPFLHEC
jgi:hypothetical protein